MGHEASLMFGHYREQLAQFSLDQAQKAKELHEKRKVPTARHDSKSCLNLVRSCFQIIARTTGDWILLVLLGVIMASLSFIMDIIIHACFDGKYLTCPC